MTLLESLEDMEPKRNVVFTAIDKLKEPSLIRQFYDEYRAEVGEEIANPNVGYVLGYYSKETMQRWFEALPKVSHPIFGRRVNVSAEEAFAKGEELGRAMKEDTQ